jgi:predicted Zn-dependent protease
VNRVTGDRLLALAERALLRAPGEALVTVSHERSQLSRFARSRPTQATAVDDLAVEITCVRDGHTATARARAVDDDSVREAAGRAAGAAAASARTGQGSYPGLPGPAEPPPPHDGWDAETARLDPAAAGRALEAAFAAAERHGLEAFGIWTAGEVRTAVASTTGARGLDAVTDSFVKVICRDGGERSGFAAAAAKSARALDPSRVAEEAARKAAPGERADLPAGKYDVVLDADAVGVLLEFVGALAFNGLAHAEGRGALVGRLGRRVAAAAINLADTPRFRSTLPRAFDAEGVPKRPIPLIQDGVAHRVVHDTRSAALAGRGARSTGHALAPGGALGGPEPTNLVLVGGGARDVHELAQPIERGLYVTRLWYVNAVHAKRTLLTGMTRDGTFLIEDGLITRPVRDVRFSDEALRILDATEALTAHPRLVTEGEFYGRRFAHGVVCPALRADGFRVTGATTG